MLFFVISFFLIQFKLLSLTCEVRDDILLRCSITSSLDNIMSFLSNYHAKTFKKLQVICLGKFKEIQYLPVSYFGFLEQIELDGCSKAIRFNKIFFSSTLKNIQIKDVKFHRIFPLCLTHNLNVTITYKITEWKVIDIGSIPPLLNCNENYKISVRYNILIEEPKKSERNRFVFWTKPIPLRSQINSISIKGKRVIVKFYKNFHSKISSQVEKISSSLEIFGFRCDCQDSWIIPIVLKKTLTENFNSSFYCIQRIDKLAGKDNIEYLFQLEKELNEKCSKSYISTNASNIAYKSLYIIILSLACGIIALILLIVCFVSLIVNVLSQTEQISILYNLRYLTPLESNPLLITQPSPNQTASFSEIATVISV